LTKVSKIFINWFLDLCWQVAHSILYYRQVKNQPDLETAWAMIKTVPFGCNGMEVLARDRHGICQLGYRRQENGSC